MSRTLLACVLAVGCGSSAPGASSDPRAAPPHVSPPSSPTTTATGSRDNLPSCSSRPAAVATGETARIMLQDGHTSPPIALALSANGRILASGGLDGMLRLWDTRTGMLLRKLASPLGTASLSADGSVLAYTTGGVGMTPSVMVVDLASESEPRALGEYATFALSPDGRTVAVGFSRLSLYDVATGRKRGELTPFPSPARPPRRHQREGVWSPNAIRQLAFDASSARLAVASGVEIVVVDVASDKVIHHALHPDYRHSDSTPSSLQFAGADTLVMADQGAAYVLSLRAGGGPPRRVGSGAFHRVAVVGRHLLGAPLGGDVTAWDLDRGTQVDAPGLARVKAVRIAASEDASTLALTRLDGGDIELRDPRTFRPLRTLEGKTRSNGALAVTPDGKELITVANDGTMARWSLVSGELVAEAAAPAGHHRPLLVHDRAGTLMVHAANTEVRVHDARSLRLARRWSTKDMVASLSFLGDTRDLLTVSTQGDVEIWQLGEPVPASTPRPGEIARPSGRPVAKIAGPVASAAVSSDGARLVAVAAEQVTTVPNPKSPTGWKWAYAESRLTTIRLPDGVEQWTRTVTTGFAQKWIGLATDGSVLLSAVKDPRTAPERMTQLGPARDARELMVFDGATGRPLRDAIVPSAGPIAVRGDAVLVGGLTPVLLGLPDLALRARVAVPDNEVRSVAAHPSRAQFVLAGDGGVASVVSATDGRVLTMLAATGGGEHVALTPEGVYRASIDGARSIGWAFRAPLEAFSFEQFAARFDRPGLVADRLAGKAVAAPARLARPPTVRLEGAATAPSSGTSRVRARAHAPTWVERVRFFVNGRAAADRLVCAASGDVEAEVALHAGRNRITAIAYDADGFASHPQAVDVVAPRTVQRPDLWIVSVGVSRYPKLPTSLQLEFADDDARSIAAALAKLAGPRRPFAELHSTTLIDEQATVEAIGGAARSLERMAPGDLAVVFLAGHGARSADGRMYYLTTGSSTVSGAQEGGVGWELLQAALGRARGRVVVLLDACHSGHVSTELVAPNEALANALAADDRAGAVVLAAARGSQLSYEVELAGSGTAGSRGLTLAWEGGPPRASRAPAAGHGLFTSAVLEALAGSAPDRDRSGATELGELIDYVTERVRAASNGKQTPWVARREMLGDFPIAEPR